MDRDDLEDEGSHVFAETIRRIHEINPATKVEVLVPDFKSSLRNLEIVIKAAPDVLAHNLDTVPRLYPKVKPKSSYKLLGAVTTHEEDVSHNDHKSGFHAGFRGGD